jgi:hypothetical protein
MARKPGDPQDLRDEAAQTAIARQKRRNAVCAALPAGADVDRAMHALDALAHQAQLREILMPNVDLKTLRDRDLAIARACRQLMKALRNRRPRRQQADREDWHTRLSVAAGEAWRLAENRIAGLDSIIAARAGRRDPHKGLIYAALMRIWLDAGGSLSFDRDPDGTPSGGLIRYLGLAHCWIFDCADPPSPATLATMIRREPRRLAARLPIATIK